MRLVIVLLFAAAAKACAFTTIYPSNRPSRTRTTRLFEEGQKVDGNDVLNAAIEAMYGNNSAGTESPEQTKARIQSLVDDNPVLLFMKGSKSFPQCGFSDTATKILEQVYGPTFETVDVLSDEAIRQGVKEFSQWPTIPQLYVAGEFIGGSDIMLEMYQSGELKTLIEDATTEGPSATASD